MITKAVVIRQADASGYVWDVNIPILNGVPDTFQEAESYQQLLEVKINNNNKLKVDQQLTREQIAKVTSTEWGNSNLQDSRYLSTPRVRDFQGKISEFTMQAKLCGMPGLENSIAPGDIVFVGFENNDMGQPIILGHLLNTELERTRQNFPKNTFSTVKVKNEATLPIDTKLTLPTGSQISMKDFMELWDWYQYFKGYSTTLISTLNPTNSIGGDTD